MDQQQFDALARRLASRRGALALAAAVLSALAGRDAVSARNKKKKRKNRGKDPQCADGQPRCGEA